MGFRLKPDQAVSSEVRRIVLRQLDLAASELVSVGDPESDEAVHDARRRVKKIRAIIRLVRPVLAKPYRSDPDLRRETISAYWTAAARPDAAHLVDVGDLMAGEERHVVVRFGFPPRTSVDERRIRARIVWIQDGTSRATEWQTIMFKYGDTAACNAEPRDPAG